jgi:hypothetical protein
MGTGIVLSCYFSGLLTGSFLCHRLIQRVGHIRAFAVFSATATAVILLHGLYLAAWFWLRKREKIEIVPVGEQVAFVPMKSTSPLAMTLDPRTDAEASDR